MDNKKLSNWAIMILSILWITYAGFYLGRVNFAVAIPGIMAEMNLSRAALGAVGLALFWAYAIGQFINGYLGDRIRPTILIGIGLGVSIFVNIMFGWRAYDLTIMIVLWAINGYFQAMGWGPSLKILNNWVLPHKYGGMASLLSTSYILGGAISTALAGAVIGALGWRYAFIVPAGVMIVLLLHYALRIKEKPSEVGLPRMTSWADPMPLLKLFRRYFLSMCITLFCINIVRYGFLTWGITYLFEQGIGISKAAFSLVAFPIAGAIGAMTCGWLSDRVFRGRRFPLLWILLTCTVIFIAFYRWVDLAPASAFILLMCIGYMIFGSHSLTIAVAPLDIGQAINTSTVTGFIDGCGYIGAGITAWLTGLLVDHFGWDWGFCFWGMAAGLAAIVALLGWKETDD